MTKKYKFQQIREAHNEFEAFLRIKGEGCFFNDILKCITGMQKNTSI